MELGAQIIYYTVWLVVAIAAGGIVNYSLARRDLRRDRAALSEAGARIARHLRPLLRARPKPVPTEPTELRRQLSAGYRVTRWLMIPLLILGYRMGGTQWGLVVVLIGLFYVPAFTLPFSWVHTHLLRLIGYRGPIVSTAIGALLGLIGGVVLQHESLMEMKVALVYGSVYGLIIGLGNTSLVAPGLVTDNRPRTLEEQERADGLSASI